MSRKIKAGVKGVAAQYITRNVALRKLQISLAEFRRLCIYKGIYPREPKKKPKGSSSNSIFYHSKDIIYLSHEPLLTTLRKKKSEIKKFRKAVHKRDYTQAKYYQQHTQLKNGFSLDHIVKERYRSFNEALSNLDDALSTIGLFASLKVENNKGISSTVINRCIKLMDEFYYYLCRSNSIKKAFISIKGYYLQAEIQDVKIVWLVPHQFSQTLPAEVDFRVLSSFLDFYCTLLKFVNFKLFSLYNLRYPAPIDTKLATFGYRLLAYKELQKFKSETTKEFQQKFQDGNNPQEIGNEFATSDPLVQQVQEKFMKDQKIKQLFNNLTFFISREIPLQIISLLIISCGGKVCWQGEGSPLGIDDPSITHHLVDRPSEHFKLVEGKQREYIQPQWVFDSINTGVLLPIDDFTVGKTLPPHLSPFVDDSKEGYIPQQREKLNKISREKQDAEDSDTPQINESREKKTEELENIHNFEYKSELENLGLIKADTDTTEQQPPKESTIETNDQDEAMRKSLLSKKHYRLLQRIERGKELKKSMAQNLFQKRKEIETRKKMKN